MTISSLADIIRTHAADRPERPALEYEGRTVTFGELGSRSSQVANALASVGVGEQDRVAFIDKNGVEYFEVTFGLAKLNAVNVAVNWRLAPIEMAQIITDAEATVVVVGPEFVAAIEKVEADLPTVQTIVAVGGHDRWLDYETWLADQPVTDPGVTAAGGDVAFQLYTSGTTGLPKGVMLTNDNFFKGVIGIADQWQFSADSVNLAIMPMFHIAGAGWSMVGLYYGCQTVLLRDVDPARILQVIPEFGITNAFMVPAVIQFLLMTPGVDDTDFSTLKMLAYGASPITDKVLVKGMETFGCQFIQVYGLTETTGAIVQLDPEDHDLNRPELLRSCGKPYPWVEMRVVDEHGQDVAVGQVGELWTRSHQNMKGYWNNPDATAQAMTDDGWFKTGDAGYVDAEGYLYLHDRVKDMIVTGGENVYPAEVENALMKHPQVADVAVIGVPDDKWGEAVKAIVVRAAGEEPTEQELIDVLPASTSPATSCPSRSSSPTGCLAIPRASCSSASCASPTGWVSSGASADEVERRRIGDAAQLDRAERRAAEAVERPIDDHLTRGSQLHRPRRQVDDRTEVVAVAAEQGAGGDGAAQLGEHGVRADEPAQLDRHGDQCALVGSDEHDRVAEALDDAGSGRGDAVAGGLFERADRLRELLGGERPRPRRVAHQVEEGDREAVLGEGCRRVAGRPAAGVGECRVPEEQRSEDVGQGREGRGAGLSCLGQLDRMGRVEVEGALDVDEERGDRSVGDAGQCAAHDTGEVQRGVEAQQLDARLERIEQVNVALGARRDLRRGARGGRWRARPGRAVRCSCRRGRPPRRG